MTYHTQGFELVKDIITTETQQLLMNAIDIHRAAIEYGDRMAGQQIKYSDDLVTDKCWSAYSFVGFEALMQMLTPRVSQVVGHELAPTYSFMRYYYPGAVMKTHLDRPACETSMTLTLDLQGEPWPIWIRDFNGQAHSVSIPERSAVVYQGTQLEHWREPYTQGDRTVQVFLHWVDPHGVNARHVRDGRPVLAVAPSLQTVRLD